MTEEEQDSELELCKLQLELAHEKIRRLELIMILSLKVTIAREPLTPDQEKLLLETVRDLGESLSNKNDECQPSTVWDRLDKEPV